MALCNEYGLERIVGVEPDPREKITDVKRALNPSMLIRAIPPAGRKSPRPCGSGIKTKKCCPELAAQLSPKRAKHESDQTMRSPSATRNTPDSPTLITRGYEHTRRARSPRSRRPRCGWSCSARRATCLMQRYGSGWRRYRYRAGSVAGGHCRRDPARTDLRRAGRCACSA